MSLRIRPAADADWSQLWPIWHQVVVAGDTYAYEPNTDRATAKAMWLDAPGGEVWLAEDEQVFGVYRISPNHDGPGAHVANGSYMVSTEARGRGVGRALVEHSLKRAAAAGYLAIQFNAVAETNVGAIGLYERLGFATIGTVPNAFLHPQAGYVGLRVMHRDLADLIDSAALTDAADR